MEKNPMDGLDAVFQKWEKRGPSGAINGGPSRSAADSSDSGVEAQLERGRQKWRDKFGDDISHLVRPTAPSRSKRRSRQKEPELPVAQTDNKFYISPAFIPSTYTRSRPFMGRACEACCPDSRSRYYNTDVPRKGMHNILNINVYARNNMFRRMFPAASFVWKLDFNRHSYVNVTKAVTDSARVDTCIQTVGFQNVPPNPITSGERVEAEKKQVKVIIGEMAAAIYKRLLRLTTWCLMKVFGGMFSNVQVHQGQIDLIKQASQEEKPLIFLPLHKSHLDYILLSFTLVSCEIQAPHVAAGDNLKNIPIFSWLMRHLGGFFIKRKLDHMSSKEELYKCILQEYVEQLLRNRQNLEFYIEGGRSRTGKALKPKSGLLSLVVNSVMEGAVPDAYIIPVNISYDKVVECRGYSRELLGQPKAPESFWQAVSSIWRVFRASFGHVRIDFAQPFSVQEFARRMDSSPAVQQFALEQVAQATRNSSPRSSMVRNYSSQSLDLYDDKWFALTKAVAHHIVYDADKCGAVMSTNMVAFLLLTKHRQGAAFGELVASFEWLREEIFLHDRDVGFSGKPEAVVHHAIRLLGDAVVLTHAQGGEAAGQFVRPELRHPQLMDLVFYSNQVVSLFSVEAVLACAIVSTAEQAGLQLAGSVAGDQVVYQSAILQKAADLGDILQREFLFMPPCKTREDTWRGGLEIFANREVLQAVEGANLTADERRWAASVAEESSWQAEEDSARAVDISYKLTWTAEQLGQLRLLQRMLSPVLEAYWLAACGLLWLKDKTFTESEFVCALQRCAEDRAERGVTLFAETCSLEPLRNALRVFKDWKVVETKKVESGSYVLSLTDKYQDSDFIFDLIDRIDQYRL